MDISNLIQRLNTANQSTGNTLKVELERSYSARLSGLNTSQPSLTVSSGKQQTLLPIPYETAIKLQPKTDYRINFTVNSSQQLLANLYKITDSAVSGAFGSQLSQLQSPTPAGTASIPLNGQATFALLKLLIPSNNQANSNQFKTTATLQSDGTQIAIGGQQGVTLPIPKALKALIQSANPEAVTVTENRGKISAQIPVSKQGEAGPTHSVALPKQQAEQWLQKLSDSGAARSITMVGNEGKNILLMVNGKPISIQSDSKLSQTAGRGKITDGKLVINSENAQKNSTQIQPILSIAVGDLTKTKPSSQVSDVNNGNGASAMPPRPSAVQKLTSAVKQFFSKSNDTSIAPAPAVQPPKQALVAEISALVKQSPSAPTSATLINLINELTDASNEKTSALNDGSVKNAPANSSSPTVKMTRAIDNLTAQDPAIRNQKQNSPSTDNNPEQVSNNLPTKIDNNQLVAAIKQQLVEAMLNEETLSTEHLKETVTQQLNHSLQPSMTNTATFASTIALALQALLGKRLQRSNQTPPNKTTEKATTTATETTNSGEAKPNIDGKTLPTNKDVLSQLQKLMEQMEGGEEKLQKSLLGIHQTMRGQQLQNVERTNEQLLHLQLTLPIADKDKQSEVQIEIKEERDKRGETSQKIWQVTLTFDLAKLGKLLATAKLQQSEVDIKLYSEQNDALRKAKRYTDLLSERLVEQGLSVKAIHCSLGKIPERTQRNSVNLLQIKV